MMELFQRHKKQLLVLGLLVVSFFLLMDLNTRLSVLFRLSRTYNVVKTEVYNLESTQQVLQTQIAYATSEDALRRFAFDRHMYQENDIPIIPFPDPKATPTPKIKPTTTPIAVQHWEKWWAVFFGE